MIYNCSDEQFKKKNCIKIQRIVSVFGVATAYACQLNPFGKLKGGFYLQFRSDIESGMWL